MLKKILKVLFLSDKRKGIRHISSNLKNVIFLFQGKTFTLSNLSEKGFGIHNPLGLSITQNQVLDGELEFDMAERVIVRVRVARIKNEDIGLEIITSSKNFRDELMKLSK